MFYENGLPCKYGHIAKRYAVSGCCIVCSQQEGAKLKAMGNPAQKKYRERNKDKMNASRRAFRWAHREEILAQNRLIAPVVNAKARMRRREIAAEDPIRVLVGAMRNGLKKRAKLKGLFVDPSLLNQAFMEAWIRAQPTCRCSGVEFQISLYAAKSLAAPSLDRLRNDEGYTLNNIRLICHRCNLRKNNSTPTLLRQIADYINRELGDCPPDCVRDRPVRLGDGAGGAALDKQAEAELSLDRFCGIMC